MTPSHREAAQALLFKTEVGPQPPIEIKARKGIVVEEMGHVDQSENIRDIILRERERAGYEVERNKVLEDKTTYGSGFARIRFETRTEPRKLRIPIPEPVNPDDPTSVERAMAGQPRIVGYNEQVQDVITYRGIVFEHISIWDIFPDPKALKIEGSPIAYRYETTYGEVLAGVEKGYYLPEAALALKNQASQETTPYDKKLVEADREIADSNVTRPDYGRKLICYELQARLPKKWVLINGQEIDDPEKLIPAVVRFHESTVIGVELNESYDGEPSIYKDDYMPVAGQFYGRGIPEMLKDCQLIANEAVNQRLDYGSIALSQRWGIIEKALVDPKDIEENRNVIRLKNPSGMNDIRQALMRLDMGTVQPAAFTEPQEWERMAQERTKVSRQTLGTAGQVNDSNKTLGGMELIKAATGDQFAYLGMLSEFDFQRKIARAFYKLIYANYSIEDVVLAIGEKRAQTFVFQTPEEIDQNYQYVPMGIYTMENKTLRQARIDAWIQRFGGFPWADVLAGAKAELQSMDEDPDLFIVPEAEAMQIMVKAQELAQGMAQQMVAQKEQIDLAKKADAGARLEQKQANAKANAQANAKAGDQGGPA